MSPLLLLLIILLLVGFGGGFGYMGHPAYGVYAPYGIGLGTVLVIILVVLLLSGRL